MNLLGFRESKKLLSKYNIKSAKTKIVNSSDQALDFAKTNGWPVVLKVFSENIIHRTEKGLVETDISNSDQLSKSFNNLKNKSRKIKDSLILIQETCVGTQLICGMKKDPVFGPVLMFGLGGIFVEVLKDVSFQIAPVSKTEARDMIKEIKGYKILKGYRNMPEVDINEIAKVILSVSKMSQENPEIKEINFNPVFGKGKIIKTADPKIIV